MDQFVVVSVKAHMFIFDLSSKTRTRPLIERNLASFMLFTKYYGAESEFLRSSLRATSTSRSYWVLIPIFCLIDSFMTIYRWTVRNTIEIQCCKEINFSWSKNSCWVVLSQVLIPLTPRDSLSQFLFLS